MSSAPFLYLNNKRQDHRPSFCSCIKQFLNRLPNGVFQVIPPIAGGWLCFLDRCDDELIHFFVKLFPYAAAACDIHRGSE